MRRSLLVATSALLALAATVVGIPSASAAVSSLTVTTTVDNARVQGSLRWALARSEQLGGSVNITLQGLNQTYVLNRCNALSEDAGTTGDLDVDIDDGISISGNNATIQQTCPGERVLHATGGPLSMNNIRLIGGDAEPDANQADPQGGGILAGHLELFNVTLEGNAATGSGGGLKADTVNLAGSTLRDNTSGLNGGGAAVLNGAHLIRSTVVGNTAGEGGGLAVGLGNVALDTSVVADNAETTPGAGTADGVEVDSFGGTVTLFHATVRGGDGDGPAIKGPTTLTASVVSQGLADAACGPGDDTSHGQNVDDDGSCDLDQGTDQADVADVGLRADLLPTDGSVLRDHDTTCVAGIDRRGVARPQDAGCEIGAFELRHRPDAEIRRKGAARFTGNDIRNLDGTDQTVQVTVGAAPTTFEVRAQNDGDLNGEVFLVRGPSSNIRYQVRYRLGTLDVTDFVTGGTFFTGPVPAGGRSQILQMIVTARPGLASGATRSLAVTFRAGTTGPRDVVVAKVRRS
jgi:hypothetical protein